MTPAQTVDAFIQAIERKDVAAAAALLAPDVRYENMPITPIVGRDAVAATLEAFLAPAGEVEWPIVSQHEVGTVVVNERVDRFRIGEGWLELPVAGFFHVENGSITLWRDYFDMGTYQRQLAALTGST